MKLDRLFQNFLYLTTPDSKRRMFKLEVPAEELELLTIKDFVQRVCDSAGCSQKETSGIKLAIDEACTNIIRHAYKGKTDGKIRMDMGIGLDDLKTKITDYGKPFDFKGIKDPDLNQYVDIGKKGGLGIWLIRKVMSRVTYKAYPDRNELVMYRRLSKAPPPQLGLKKGAISVSIKFTVGAVMLVAILFVVFYFSLSRHQEDQAFKQQRQNVNLVLGSLASESGQGVSRKDDLGLENLVRQIKAQDAGRMLDYVFIVGSEGLYLAHSDVRLILRPYKPPQGAKFNPKGGIQTFKLQTPEGGLNDYAAPIYYQGQFVGEVHVAVTNTTLQESSRQIKSDIRNQLLFASFIIMVFLWLLSRIIIQPFRKILVGINAMSAGDMNAKIELNSQDEFGQLAGIFNEMTNKLQESQKGVMEQERMQKEMQVAQQIQHTLLPADFPQVEGYEIGATYRAAKEVGGDYYDFFWVDPTTLGIVVADVSGKGVPGSMVMTMIRTAMRLEARGNKSASDVLGKVNRHVTSDMKRGMFVTMFYIILDSRTRAINFASAGHNPMILYRGKTKEVYFLKPKGFPVGIDLPEEEMFSRNLALQKVSLEKNDMLVIYTDGITEAMNEQKDQFGEERLVKVIKENSHLTPQEFVEQLNQAIAQFTKGAEQNDDITVVAIKEKMKAEAVEFKFRKKLLDLVEKKGLSVAAACRQMNVSPNAYYRFKKMVADKGRASLKPMRSERKGAGIRELTVPQRDALMALLSKNPDFGPKRLSETLKKTTNPPMRVDAGLIYEHLKRKSLSTMSQRKAFAALSGDIVINPPDAEAEQVVQQVKKVVKRPKKVIKRVKRDINQVEKVESEEEQASVNNHPIETDAISVDTEKPESS